MPEDAKDLIEIRFSRDDIPVSEDSSRFEQIIAQEAEKRLVEDGNDPSWYRLADIGIEEDGFIAIMKMELKEEIEAAEFHDEIEFGLDEEPPQAESDENSPKPSAAYDGPWEERKFELDVVQLCAMMDIVEYVGDVSRPIEMGGTGMITDSLHRSLGVINNFCIKNACIIDQDEIRRSIQAGKPVEITPDPDFKKHFNKWKAECLSLFEEKYGPINRKVVQAKMMPGKGFDPRGGKGGLFKP